MTSKLVQKLGGARQLSPDRPSNSKLQVDESPMKPSTSVQHERRKPRRTLERVLTNDRSTSQRPSPSLLRSATDPVLPMLKREESDTRLAAIPLNRVAMHKRYSQREVDLHAAARANETKRKNKAKAEHELRDAITALRKPNPRMAVKEFVEDAEKRVAGSRMKSR